MPNEDFKISYDEIISNNLKVLDALSVCKKNPNKTMIVLYNDLHFEVSDFSHATMISIMLDGTNFKIINDSLFGYHKRYGSYVRERIVTNISKFHKISEEEFFQLLTLNEVKINYESCLTMAAIGVRLK